MSKKTLAYFIIIIVSITTGVAYVFFKLVSAEGLFIWQRVLYFSLGSSLFIINLFLFLIAYRYERISVLYPLTALTYPVTFVLGIIIFDESVTVTKTLGTILVLIGSYLMARKEVGQDLAFNK